ncbi:T9SS type A sorting domain-containing protein [Flavobacterium rhizosphaerae]|uniref:T9SS type A sorting domain-containing protein n=1 Tax=Flavobacterium rhizosphaerae TaxID=3163298 RepID=A0ABW8Z2E3_9FLAO
MKTKLLLFLLSFSCFAVFGQEQVNMFYTYPSIMSSPEVTEAVDNYALVSSETIDESQDGENVVWNFDDLQLITYTHTQFRPATTAEVEEYPAADFVVETFIDGQEDPTSYMLSMDENMLSNVYFVGGDMGGYSVNYTDNAFIGNFPLSYGYINTDEVEGTYQAAIGISGTFTGFATVEVDAYGTLTVNQGVANNTPVVRMRLIQTLSINYMGLPAGLITQNIYNYYDVSEGSVTPNPIFRIISTNVDIPALSLDETTRSYESYIDTTAGTQSFKRVNLAIAPNPVGDVLHITGDTQIQSVTVTDAAGRIVASGTGNDIAVSHISTGIYYVTVENGLGRQAIKMVKK